MTTCQLILYHTVSRQTLSFLFSNNCEKSTDFNNFWHVVLEQFDTKNVNAHLDYTLLPHCTVFYNDFDKTTNLSIISIKVILKLRTNLAL